MFSVIRYRKPLRQIPLLYRTFLLLGCLIVSYVLSSTYGGHASSFDPHISTDLLVEPDSWRLLSTDDSCSPSQFDKTWGIGLYTFIMLYLFLALAIICDDFFVASLEIISERLDLSDDVAGATFMAAGSSAPEFFTSLVDAFIARNGVGIGTIIGSALFNILVIVGATGIVTGKAMDLEAWPLFRDCTFYLISIALMIWTFLDSEVHWWEALVLVFTYSIYVMFMKFNERLRGACLKGKSPDIVETGFSDARELEAGDEEVVGVGKQTTRDSKEAVPQTSMSTETLHCDDSTPLAEEKGADPTSILDMVRPTKTYARDGYSAKVGMQFPWHRSTSFIGDRETLQKRRPSRVYPVDDNGSLANVQENVLLAAGGVDGSSPSSDRIVSIGEGTHSESDGDSDVSNENEFNESSVSLDEENADREEAIKDTDIVKTAKESEGDKNGNDAEMSSDADKNDDGGHSIWHLEWPKGTMKKLVVLFSAPIVYMFRLTVPDCRRKKWKEWYLVTFLVSIVYIGLFSHFMVDMASRLGCIFGVPAVVMGLTVLAAGTSVPDMLSSVAVAEEGHGDMAVSNAVGSNVFDILLGLGFPWFLASLIYGVPFPVEASNVLLWTLILCASVLVFILSIIFSGYKLHPKIGVAFILIYVIFVIYVLITTFFLGGL
eukprot:TRINITY_DN80502_c0_g1_i1.p1 TRINITY_DN80502_c0_g1~~TRINITY_DN80502_c0_g1_i1.p1  ORF type:complete len:660 (+),score=145.05 TRINITY_DN80502_c0_g1_i1:141-2120(+)